MSSAAATSGLRGATRDHGRETRVPVVLRWTGVLRGSVLHASAGSRQGEGLTCAAEARTEITAVSSWRQGFSVAPLLGAVLKEANLLWTDEFRQISFSHLNQTDLSV